MITLLTGQPGHGKTLRALWLALQERAKGRDVYACRVRGLDAAKTGFKEIGSLAEWQGLPDGSLVIVDECYEDIPARGPGKQPPEWEQALATHRHRGFDFILICQLGSQISAFVRGLVNDHTHVRRKFGFERSTLLTWDRYQAAVSSTTECRDARTTMWKYPREVFDLYKSAEVHTVKRSLPWQFLGIPVLLGLVVFCFWFVFHRMQERGQADAKARHAASEESATVDGKPVGKPQPGTPDPPKPMTTEEYLQQYVPRVAVMPWSAPWHDQVRPKAEPDLYCMAIDDGKRTCRCYTEQMTRIAGIANYQCQLAARFGVYNPFRQAVQPVLHSDNSAEKPTQVPDRDYSAFHREQGGSAVEYQSLPAPVPRAMPEPMNAGSAWPVR